MKTIMITAPCSGSGKTTITMGIIRALRNMGLDVCSFKTGPDYIDKAFGEVASGKKSGNLDMHLQGRAGMIHALSFADSDYCIVEGAMGYFDGIYNTYENSSYDISKCLKINAVLVYTPKGEMFSVVPKVKGMVDFEGSRIRGIILNKINENQYVLLKEQIERYTDIKVLGYIPKGDNFEIQSRHLGLIQSVEISDIDKRIDIISEDILRHIDINGLLCLMGDINCDSSIDIPKGNIRAAVALDEAFSFYYRENIKLLENCCNVIYFSPLRDKEIPECDFVYIGGGYPEVFKEELSKNRSMIDSIRQYADNGGYLYAECGGFMYLTKEIEGKNMVGIFEGRSSLTDRLQRFGYIDIELVEDCFLGKKGDKITAHEFHKSITKIDGKEIFNIRKAMGNKEWKCGYRYKNVIAGYPHINFLGNMKSFKHLIDELSSISNRRI